MDAIDLTLPPVSAVGSQQLSPAETASTATTAASFLPEESEAVERARATQPNWSSPLITTTGLLENRLRFDVIQQHAGNGTSTTVLDGGRGLDLIVGDNSEIQIAAPPFADRTSRSRSGDVSGFGDWPFLRLEQRFASSPESAGNYVLTGWLQIQAPTGIKALTSNAWSFTPTFAFGKGWGNFDVQGTIATVLPVSRGDTLGHPVQTNLALQYHTQLFWPELEASWTYYPDGARGGLNQIFLTAGLVIGRFVLADDLRFTFGAGYEVAIAPSYRAKPLAPAYENAWLFTSRLNFD